MRSQEIVVTINMFTDNYDMINERDINICDNHQTCDGVITGLMTTFSKDNDLMVMIMIK